MGSFQKGVIDTAKEMASEAAEAVKEKASEAAEAVKGKASEAYSKVTVFRLEFMRHSRAQTPKTTVRETLKDLRDLRELLGMRPRNISETER
ncbi:unnamed protein product [Gongylonema pulchrum]|uniref:Uncharacterized protein n=1 Tax=Gongylonema pulchrum TaxID=637853 RepID=A0A183D3L3_9BILA|nr:unnamed protein product [Gongylonema pulchrum]